MKQVKLGKLVATSHVLQLVTDDVLLRALHRHANGDWGDLNPQDWALNDHALEIGLRLMSVYRSNQDDGVRFWIITEADRSVTTVLLPEDY